MLTGRWVVGLGSPVASHLGALGVAKSHLLSCLPTRSGLLPRSLSSGSNGSGKHSSVYITDTDGNVNANTPLLLGLVNYFERHLPFVGYFAPIGGSANPSSGSHPMDRHLRLVHDTFEPKYDVKQMMGVPEEEAVRLVAAGQRAELLDRVYAAFAAFREMHDMVIVHGTSVGGRATHRLRPASAVQAQRA
eukprot:GHRQ01030204.1.p1 GENE.GHRQ01030204.1~~GHRQ01030204.1.p1  ORF type:complete len:190 (+),score=57.14 GHRQ01030204.1:123-692(+)